MFDNHDGYVRSSACRRPIRTIQLVEAKEFLYCSSGGEAGPNCGLSKEDCKDAQKAGNGNCYNIEGEIK